jgi:hypothetical protein
MARDELGPTLALAADDGVTAMSWWDFLTLRPSSRGATRQRLALPAPKYAVGGHLPMAPRVAMDAGHWVNGVGLCYAAFAVGGSVIGTNRGLVVAMASLAARAAASSLSMKISASMAISYHMQRRSVT